MATGDDAGLRQWCLELATRTAPQGTAVVRAKEYLDFITAAALPKQPRSESSDRAVA